MDDDYPMTIGNWMITMLILAIPVINIIMILVWAFGLGNTSRKTYCQASLLWMLIIIGAAFVFGGVAPILQELLPTE